MGAEFVKAWRVANPVNFLMLDALTDESLKARYAPRTRTVASQFAHMHNIRVSLLQKR